MKTNIHGKKLAKLGLALLTMNSVACGTSSLKNQVSDKTQIIEFKSGPEGFDTRTFFYVGSQEVVAIDSQFTPELAKASIDHLRKHTDKPITWLVITHPNPDKFNGAGVFKTEGAMILASENTKNAIPGVHGYKEYFFVEMAKIFKKGTYPQPVAVDQTFTGEMDLVLKDGERLQLKELSQAGVSSTQTVVFSEKAQSLFVGDLIHHKAHAWLEGGIENGKATPRISEWIQSLNELQSLFPEKTTVLGGRGENATLGVAVKSQVQYLKKAQAIVKSAVQKTKAEPNYKKLAESFAIEFPDYGLAYMIEYGAYGLAQSELSKLKK
jgi:glyoxylase-like metal-dependent hydrolase (beta-lactamase superfamily II)